MEKKLRKSGILMHITSLPNKYGWGKFSKEAFEFVDFLKSGNFTVWEVLPFSPTLYGNSPYSTYSSFAINPNFLDLTEFLTEEEIKSFCLDKCRSLSDYTKNMEKALQLVCKKVRDNFNLEKFIKDNSFWIKDYALFVVLKKKFNCPWYEFSEELKNRNKSSLQKFYIENKEEIEDVILIQFLLHSQWQKIKDYAKQNGIEIFGDVPFYVELDSADVWANPNCWELENGKPKLVAGVPPDYFNSEGQLWGYPIYNYENLEKENFKYFIKKFQKLSELFDIIRIDHFIGFSRYYSIPAKSKTAKNGKWNKGAGEKLLNSIIKNCKSQIVAEDLGTVTEEVKKLKDRFLIPGVKVLQFAFDNVGDNAYQPHNYEKNCVAYIGTHDNNTFMGLLNEGDWDKINRFKRYFQMPLEQGNDVVVDNAILSLYRSSANVVIITMQDLLKLGAEARMNTPGVPEGNWTWQLHGKLDPNLCWRYRELSYLYAR